MFAPLRRVCQQRFFCCQRILATNKYVNKRCFATAIDDSLSYRFYPGDSPLIDITVGQLFDRAVKHWPDRECIVSVHQGIRLTYSEVLMRADKLAAGLKKLGLKQGDRVGIWGPNDCEWLLAFIAITRAGCIMVGINPAYQQNELNYCLNKVAVSAVIAPDQFRTQNYAKMLLNAKETCPTLKHIILWSKHHVKGAHRFADIEALAGKIEVESITAGQEEISTRDGCNIQFTSGTTGQPKAPLLSHHSFVNNGQQSCERFGLSRKHHRVCLNVPFFHAFGMIQGCMVGFHAGTTFVLESPSFNPKKSIDAIIKEKCTITYGTPTMWVNMLDVQERIRAPIETLEFGTTGGAIASPNLLKKMRRVFGLKNSLIIYGLTESTAVVFQTKPEESDELNDFTVGLLQNDIEAMVVNEKGLPVPLGSPGELWIRGYCIMMKYWNDPELTAKTVNNEGWLITGDKFILHANGHGEVIGRLKDMIIRGGENIFPKEIENFLETYPDILEAHVFGVDDDVYGEEIYACIKLKDNRNVTDNDIKSYAKGKIAHFKIPRYIKIVNEFPKTTSGKVQKFKLKKEIESQGIK